MEDKAKVLRAEAAKPRLSADEQQRRAAHPHCSMLFDFRSILVGGELCVSAARVRAAGR